ncbi:MAG: hypothetical protein HC880_03015 [Bacteroidia bacterium]|nr:hypothetical protein [Bacteroidia bacterium]
MDEEDIYQFLSKNFDRDQIFAETAIAKTQLISTELLQHGLRLRNYLIGKIPGEDTRCHLLLQIPELNKWLYLASYPHYSEAVLAAQILIDYIRELNIKSEGFYLIEHILMRPQTTDEKFGLYLRDELGQTFLKSARRYTFSDRQQQSRQIEDAMFNYDHYSIERREDGDFEIHFQAGNLLFVSMKAYESVQEIHEKMDRIYTFLANKEDVVPLEDKIAFYIQNSNEDRPVPRRFFCSPPQCAATQLDSPLS